VNNIFLNSEIELSFRNLLKKLSEISKTGSLILHQTKSGIIFHTQYQFLFNYKPASPLEARLYEMIIGHAVDAEKMGPGAFDKTIQLILEYSQKYLIGVSISDFLKNIQNTIQSTPATINDVADMILDPMKSQDSKLSSLFMEAVNLAGFGGKIIVEKTHAQTPSVELNCGYSFDVKPAWPINVKLENVKVFVIDGFIESVSEIHHLLEKLSESKSTAMFFARGMSPDVISTLRVNFDRGSLKVVPVIVNFDLEGINSLNDIAIVSGCDVVSSNKGNLISCIDVDVAPTIESATIYPTKITLQHGSTSRSVASHVSYLKNKRLDDSMIEDVSKLYDKRIRSLSPNHVLIRLPDDRNFVIASQTIDLALRGLRSLVDYGVIEVDGKKMPTAMNFAAGTFASKCLSQILNVGAVISFIDYSEFNCTSS
jgi:chaperonin GroEL (HSP60 family)